MTGILCGLGEGILAEANEICNEPSGTIKCFPRQAVFRGVALLLATFYKKM